MSDSDSTHRRDDGPLAGIRVLDYAQYVAGPFATMLLADLGAEVIKVEPPRGDAWRHYEPITPDGGRWFISLNRNKKSVVADLKTPEGREFSDALIRTADIVVHNMPPARAKAFGLDRERVRAVNADAVWCCVSAFGSSGPEASTLGYDLIAQAASGLLLADVQLGEEVPRRSGGVAMADLTAGLLTLSAALVGLADRLRRGGEGNAKGIEVSLLGASLAVQVQRFVSVDTDENEPPAVVDRARLADAAAELRSVDELEPYYRCYEAADGFVALACLNQTQRTKVQSLLGVDDPWASNPQALPADAAERAVRAALKDRFAAKFVTRPVRWWLQEFSGAGVPLGPVRDIAEAHHSAQVRANGLVQRIDQPGFGPVSVLGSVFKVEGVSATAERAAPGLGEHTDHFRSLLSQTVVAEGASR